MSIVLYSHHSNALCLSALSSLDPDLPCCTVQRFGCPFLTVPSPSAAASLIVSLKAFGSLRKLSSPEKRLIVVSIVMASSIAQVSIAECTSLILGHRRAGASLELIAQRLLHPKVPVQSSIANTKSKQRGTRKITHQPLSSPLLRNEQSPLIVQSQPPITPLPSRQLTTGMSSGVDAFHCAMS